MQSEDATNITNVYKERTKVAVAMVGISTDDYMVRILSDECFEVTPGYKTETVIYTDINMVDILSNNCYLVDPGYRTEKYMTTITHTVQSQNNPFILILLGVLSVIAFSYLHLKPNISPKKLIEKVVKKIDNDDFVELKEIMKKIESDDFVKLMESMKIDVSDLREAVGELDLSKREVTEIEKLLKKMKSLENLPHFESLAIHNMQSALQNSTVSQILMSVFLSLILYGALPYSQIQKLEIIFNA